MTQPVPPDVQMARVKTLAKLKDAIEAAVDKYRDFPRNDLSNGQFAAQILLAIYQADIAFYLDQP